MTVLRWKNKVLLAKLESAYATNPVPSGAANAILATDVELRPMEGEDVSRNLELPYLGAQSTIAAALSVTLTFSTELAGSGAAGVAPAWGVLARGCGCAETIEADTSVEYSPVSSAHESLWFLLNIDGVQHAIKGARGTAELQVNAQGIPVIRWTFNGLFVAPVDAAAATPTLTGFKAPLIAAKANTPTFTIDGVALVLRSATFSLGNDVQKRLLIGKEEILIVDRAEAFNCVVEATQLATFDPFALALDPEERVAVSLVHGTAAGNIATLSLPTAQVKRPTGYQNNQGLLEWPLSLLALPDTGNDQFSLTLT